MNPISLILITIAVSSFVVGQLVLKKGMERGNEVGFKSRVFLSWLLAGVAAMTVSFFLTLGLLQRFDLSYLYPFQGLSVIIISISAAVILKERLTARLLLGALLISAGVVLVSIS